MTPDALRPICILLLVAFSTPLVDATQHEETVTLDYDGAAGTVVPFFGGLSVNCGPSCYGTGLAIGGGTLQGDPSTQYANVIVETQDRIWGQNAANSACFWNPAGNPDICQGHDGDVRTGAHCGTIRIDDSRHPGNQVTVWAWTLLVTETNQVCGASAGTITATLS